LKRRLVTAFQRYLLNPAMRSVDRLRLLPRSVAILETTGRKSGRARRTPVGNGLEGDTFWLVAEHGHASDYVRNIQANPRVRVKVGGRWRTGTAHVLPDEDPLERQRQMWNRLNAAAVRLAGTELLVIRIDLARDLEDAAGV
jgi:deazaflavin-dependent oxidoreductase (nitroreductase family)